MSSRPIEKTLKRPRISTTSNISARRPAKRKKGLGNDNNSDKDVASSDSEGLTLLRPPTNDFDNLAGPSDNPGHLSALRTGNLNGSERTMRQRTMRHSQSASSLVSRGRGAIVQKRVTRSIPRNAEDSLSDDEIDILGEERRLWKLLNQSRGRHRLIELPIAAAEQHLNQDERTSGLSTPSGAPTPGEEAGWDFAGRKKYSVSSSNPSLNTSQSKWLSKDSTESSEDSLEGYEFSQETYRSVLPHRPTSRSKKILLRRGRDILTAADEDDSPTTLLNGASNANTEDFDVHSLGAFSDSDEVRDIFTQDKQLNATMQLGVETGQIKSLFGDLGLPLSPERIPRSYNSASGEVEYHTASTVTQDVLTEHGSWEFAQPDPWNIVQGDGQRRTIHAVDAYVPISLAGDLLDIMLPPTEVNSADQPMDLDLTSDIHAFLDGRKEYMEDRRNKIYLDKADATDTTRNDKVDNALLIPLEYKEILDLHEIKMELEKRNIGQGIDASLGDDSLPRSSPLRYLEAETPEHHSRQEPASPLVKQGLPSAGPSCKDFSVTTDSQSFLPSTHAVSEKIPPNADRPNPLTPKPVERSVAEILIEEHKLKLTLADAQELERLLKEKEPECARRRSRQRLVQKTGTTAERSQLQKEGKTIPLRRIEYVSREIIDKRDKERRVGNAMINRDASDPNFGAAERILKWIDLQPLNPTYVLDKKVSKHSGAREKRVEEHLSEVTVEAHVGPLVKGIFWGHEHLKESENKSLRFLDCFHLFGTNPKADYAVRLSGTHWVLWGFLLALCLLSGECKPSRNFGTKTEAQMAMNSVPALLMLILVHLSTRRTSNQKLLPWMFIYAFCYTERGVTIYAHFPKFVVAPDGKGKGQWKFVSWKVTDKFEAMWADSRTEDLRICGLAALYLMRSHTEFVLEQLLAWSKHLPDSALPIIDRLIARSQLELGEWDWLLRKAHEGRQNLIEAA